MADGRRARRLPRDDRGPAGTRPLPGPYDLLAGALRRDRDEGREVRRRDHEGRDATPTAGARCGAACCGSGTSSSPASHYRWISRPRDRGRDPARMGRRRRASRVGPLLREARGIRARRGARRVDARRVLGALREAPRRGAFALARAPRPRDLRDRPRQRRPRGGAPRSAQGRAPERGRVRRLARGQGALRRAR